MKSKLIDKPSILIIDEENDNLARFRRLFDDGYKVFTTESGKEAKQLLRQNHIQVVVSDQRMFQGFGVDFLQEFSEPLRIILTGIDDSDVLVKAAAENQVYHCFFGSWKELEMKQVVENALESVFLTARLKQNEEVFRQLSDNIREILWLVSTDWKELLYVSTALESIFDLSEEQLHKDPLSWLKSVHPEDLESVENAIKGIEDKLDSGLDFPEFRIVKADGTIRWITFKIVPVRDLNDRAYRIAGLMEDITESKQTLEILVQSEKMKSMGGLAAGLAHELNNPLSGIIQGSQLIEQRFSSDLKKNVTAAEEAQVDLTSMNQYLEKRSVLRILGSIKDSGLRASKIISDMLSIARQSDSRKGSININSILDNIINISRSDYDMKKRYGFKNINIIKEIEETLPLITCNESEIGQVVLSLFKNSAQAMKTDETNKTPTITIRANLVGENVKLEIEDNGPGMEEEVKSRVFEPFFTTRNKAEGTGLGLSISKTIITLNHKGAITVDSTPGEGTTFRIILPCFPDQA
jgi:PAS domain S-box-containing protein